MEEFTYRWMEPDEIERLGEIDRSEKILGHYNYQNGRLQKNTVDWDVPTWSKKGTDEYSLQAQITFCREHLAKNGRMLGAFNIDQTLVGIGIIEPNIEPGITQLAFLYTSNAFRRQGIAQQLVANLSAEAKRLGNHSLYVSATPSGSAVGFYLSQGFEVTDNPIPKLLELEPEDIQMLRKIA